MLQRYVGTESELNGRQMILTSCDRIINKIHGVSETVGKISNEEGVRTRAMWLERDTGDNETKKVAMVWSRDRKPDRGRSVDISG